MIPYLQRSLQQVLSGDDSSSSGSSINNDDNESHNREVEAIAAAEDTIDRLIDTEVTVSVTISEIVPEKLFTVDSPNETSSSGGTENDFEIVSNESSSPIASPTTIMAEHDENNYGVGEEAEDTDKFTKTLNNPKGVSDMELREKRQRLRWAIYFNFFLHF